MKHKHIPSFFFLLFLGCLALAGRAQEKERSYLKLYFQQTNSDLALLAELKVKRDGRFVGIPQARLRFGFETDSSSIDLGEGLTDASGTLLFSIPEKKQRLLSAPAAIQVYTVAFGGDSLVQRKSASVEVQRIALSVKLGADEQPRTVAVSARRADGTDSVLTEVPVQLLVRRMFGWHKLDEGQLDEGRLQFEFPENLTVAQGQEIELACLVETDEMGRVLVTQSVPWATTFSQAEPAQRPATRAYLLFVVLATALAYGLSWFFSRIIKQS